MRIVHFEKAGVPGIAVNDGSGWHGLAEQESGFPGTLPELIAQGVDLLRMGKALSLTRACVTSLATLKSDSWASTRSPSAREPNAPASTAALA